MSTEFALDLRLARRKAGYTQRDIAHLLAAQQSAVSDLEHGRKLPSLTEIVTLSLIYGRSFESLFSAVMQDARQSILGRQKDLSNEVRSYVGTFNRTRSIKRLNQRLTAEEQNHGGS